MEQEREPSDKPVVAFAPYDLGQILPFFLMINDSGIVTNAGRAILKLFGDEKIIGRSVFEILSVKKPRRFDPTNGFRDVLGQRLRLELHGLGALATSDIFGMAFPAANHDTAGIVIAATPGVNVGSFVETHGLRVSDFGPADGSADLLPLLAMQSDMLEDSKKQSKRLREARDAAERLANHDALTGLPNRRAFMKKLSVALAIQSVAVVHIDLDRFKEINDSYGHAAGDAALKHAAEAMTDILGGLAYCARLGGDEFVAMIEAPEADIVLHQLSEALIARLSDPFMHESELLSVGVSIGMARAGPASGLTADDILHQADLALYSVKRSGRGHIQMCTPALLNEQLAFQSLISEMRRGLAEQEFKAYLQPQVEARTGRVLGFEALARWNHPDRGVITPPHFLQEAERAGLMQEIDKQIRSSALDALRMSDRSTTPIPKISLNVTIKDLMDPCFRETLIWDLQSKSLRPERVQLEIVEAVLFDQNTDSITAACKSFVNEGFALALDDFGTGHASVLSLMNLPVSVAKVDRAFTNGLTADSRTAAMAKALVGIAQTLGLDVLAEGVNDPEDVDALRQMGCEAFQSFLFGRPMAIADALAWLAARPPVPMSVLKDASG